MAWLAPHDPGHRRSVLFSDALIWSCLTSKVLFKLPLRQTAQMEDKLLKMDELLFASLHHARVTLAAWRRD